jgi:TldD protein
MVKKLMDLDLLKKALEKCSNIGANFLEIRYDDLQLRTLNKQNDIWSEIQSKKRRGIGVAAYVDGALGYSSTPILTIQGITEAAKAATRIAKVSSEIAVIKLPFSNDKPVVEKHTTGYEIKKHPKDVELDYKIDMVERGMESAKAEAGKELSSVDGLYGELYGKKLFVNSEGSEIDWDFLITDMRIMAVCKGVDGLVTGMDGVGGSNGLEVFSNRNSPELFGKNAGKWAKEQLKAKKAPAGDFRCLAEERLVGVLAHESFGHLSEADFIVSQGSPLTDRLGEEIANSFISIYDIGIPDIKKHGGLYLPFDDQGSRTDDTTIVEDGVLKGYLNTRGTATYFGDKRTGNSRAVNFTFHPIPRMKNTYISPGDYSHDEAIEELKNGIYAIRTSGGQVETDGQFLFKAQRGYFVENGEIKYPLKEVSLSGNILDMLKHIEGGTKNLELSSGYFGGCGKGNQYPLPVGLGGPEILFNKVRFGGEASKKSSDLTMNF